MKAVASKLSLKDAFQVKKYSRNRKCLSLLVNMPNNREEAEVKCWTVDQYDAFCEHDVNQYTLQFGARGGSRMNCQD